MVIFAGAIICPVITFKKLMADAMDMQEVKVSAIGSFYNAYRSRRCILPAGFDFE